MISKKEKNIIINFLKNQIDPELIYIFGSFSRDKERRDSDIDIAFLSSAEFEEYNIFLLAQRLADKLNRDVDLIALQKASTVFRIQIIQGELIYKLNEAIKMNFELKCLREYAKLNEERKPILDNLKN